MRSRFLLGALSGIALLRDMFSSVNNRVNGFEHVLRRRKGGRKARYHSVTFWKPNGAQECARRRRHLARRGIFHGVHLQTGGGALLRVVHPGLIHAQFDDSDHKHSSGWTAYPAHEFAVSRP